jgi:hypothetical protein
MENDSSKVRSLTKVVSLLGELMKRLLLIASILAATTAGAQADVAGQHPNYTEALSDLRAAKFCLAKVDTATAMKDEIAATEEINASLKDVMTAAVTDQKNVEKEAAPDAGEKGNRLERALELLGKVKVILAAQESDATVLPTKASAAKHVDLAVALVEKCIKDDAAHK